MEALQSDIEVKIRQESEAFFNGIVFYKNHPFSRIGQTCENMLNIHGAELKRYGNEKDHPVLLIPSLINSADILDLFPEASLIRFLTDQSYQVFCIEWGRPNLIPLSFGIGDYISEILIPFFEFIQQISTKKPHLLGYCMGGIFALILGQLLGKNINKIALLAPPFDFSVKGISYDQTLLSLWHQWILESQEHIHEDFIPYVFFIKKPFQFIEKYAKFNSSFSEEAQKLFVGIEDWLNTPMPLAKQVGAQVICDWFLKNALKNGTWKVDGLAFNPSSIQNPIALVSPKKDSVIPPHSNHGFKELLPRCTLLEPDLGHVGIVANPKAKLRFWPQLNAFLKAS